MLGVIMKYFYTAIIIIFLLNGCKTNPEEENSNYSNDYPTQDEVQSIDDPTDSEDTEYSEDIEPIIHNGTHSATVDYYNPSTGTSSSYTLDVEVDNNMVMQINFPNDGYLDDSHISPTYLGISTFENCVEGKATLYNEDNVEYAVTIEECK